MNRLSPGNLRMLLWVFLTALAFVLPWWLVPADPMPAASARGFACLPPMPGPPVASASPAVATNPPGPQTAGGATAALYSTSPTQGEP